MTKAELIAALEPFTDDQYVYVCIHDPDGPHGVERGAQLIIQDVRAKPPWRSENGCPDLVGLVVQSRNGRIPGVPESIFGIRLHAEDEASRETAQKVLSALESFVRQNPK